MEDELYYLGICIGNILIKDYLLLRFLHYNNTYKELLGRLVVHVACLVHIKRPWSSTHP